VLEFAERSPSIKTWSKAQDIDRGFLVKLRAFLNQCRTTRNGRAAGIEKPLSVRQINNILECLRSMLNWARDPLVGKLPVGWVNPATKQFIGARPLKDPLRPEILPLETRIRLVERMDRWQLCQCSWSLVLPMRADEVVGLNISDVCFDRGWLQFHTRFGGGDFNKGRQDFNIPFPPELVPMLRACMGTRREGPLLRSRAEFQSNAPGCVSTLGQLVGLFEQAILDAGNRVQTEQDRKQVFRQLLRELGGTSLKELYREWKSLFRAQGLGESVTLRNLREAVTTSMKQAKVPHLELRYLTSHTTRDILNEYVVLDPVGAMQTYFREIEPLLAALKNRAQVLGIGD
jgi:integrase